MEMKYRISLMKSNSLLMAASRKKPREAKVD